MFIRTVPFLVTICFRLKVFSFSLGGSNAVLRSAKGSASDCCCCCSCCCCCCCCWNGSKFCCWNSSGCECECESCCDCWPGHGRWVVSCPGLRRLCEPPSCAALPAVAPGLCVPRPDAEPTVPCISGASPCALLPRLPEATASNSRGEPSACGPSSKVTRAKLAVTGLSWFGVFPSASTPRSKIFINAFSIFLMVTLSITWKATSSGLVSRTCGCVVSWRKRHKPRITCTISSAPRGGSLLPPPNELLTCRNNPSGTGAVAAATRPSLPWRSKRSRGMSFFVFCRSITAVMK
mmetsp:Transcript_119032/g.384355  ORF Transcript_119032/g.384355 Transcript_119032/m.384355 type:complete len:292 (-) Transcript_119032:753-1628(-)